PLARHPPPPRRMDAAWLLIGVSRVAPRAGGCRPPAGSPAGSGVQDGQAPAPSGKLAGDRDHADRRALAPSVQPTPALVEPAVATLGPLPDHSGLTGLAALQLPAQPIWLSVVPRLLHPTPSGPRRA